MDNDDASIEASNARDHVVIVFSLGPGPKTNIHFQTCRTFFRSYLYIYIFLHISIYIYIRVISHVSAGTQYAFCSYRVCVSLALEWNAAADTCWTAVGNVVSRTTPNFYSRSTFG